MRAENKIIAMTLTSDFAKALLHDQENEDVVALFQLLEEGAAGLEHPKSNLENLKEQHKSTGPDFVEFAEEYIKSCPSDLFRVLMHPKADTEALKTTLKASPFAHLILDMK